ncbi:MAG TPA: DUF5979 domain-containing protein [Nocardioides sp.]|uniref:DUF5979 domain-containing protein n=1 Tax=Nocardioides sp. TaxID=35761 RepID=UPI002B794887|nr:DUF5979 domain-containing protein [Nocardioides sp.]HQR27400.1 DUF5979 domain-containing protein [Nocardioides sp.]
MASVGLAGSFAATGAAPASAEDPGFLTVDKQVQGWVDGHLVAPGETFDYTITVTCTNVGSGGCTSARLADTLPDWLTLNGAVEVVGSASTVSSGADSFTVDFTEPLADPVGGQGLAAGSTATITVPVRVDPDTPASASGTDLVNTATVTASNAATRTDSFTVVPDVPVTLEAATSKAYAPDSGIAVPGTTTTLTLTGGNASNVPVDRIVLLDPVDPGAAPNPFDHLALTGGLDLTLPAGAEQVQVDVWVGGAWINGPPGPTAQLPAGVTPADVTGLRITFSSTDGADIPIDAGGSLAVELAQRDDVLGSAGLTVANEVSTTVAVGAQTSPPATAQDSYSILPALLPVAASKTFTPDAIAVGQQSTVTLGATNSSARTLDSLSLTEPGAGPNPFQNGLTFDGFTDAVVWPRGATGATVDFRLDDGSTVTLDAGAPDTLPDPPAGTVVGFTVTFTGPVVPGAEATVPFTVTAATDQAADEVQHPNEVLVESTAPGGYAGQATAQDTLTTIVERLAVEVDKTVTPSTILSIPGEPVTAQLTGTLLDFPASTVDATQMIVSDPANPATDQWYDAFKPIWVAATPIPAGATLTVQHWDGGAWTDVPGMVDLAGPDVFSGELPTAVQDTARGLRFVYDFAQGLAPGGVVAPNIVFELRPEMAGAELDIENAPAVEGSNGDLTDEDEMTEPPGVGLEPPTPGVGDLVDKAWDTPKTIGERTGSRTGFTLTWSTGGRSHLDHLDLTDVAGVSAATLPDSAFDAFDLVRIDPITAADDPLLTYDRVAGVELYSLAADGWVEAANDPCPAACDGTFPGLTLTAAEQADTIGFRLVLEESPTRGDRNGTDPTAPLVGSGVARSFAPDRRVHAVVQIRDELRSDADVPVVASATYNVAGEPGAVRNTVRADGYAGGSLVVSDTAQDSVLITAVPVTVDLTKTWSGGPLGVPPVGTAPQDRPSGRVTLTARNTTPRRIDRLTISDPTGGTQPFDSFDLTDLVSITAPASLGAADVVVRLQYAAGGTADLTRAQALAATAADLADVVGFDVVYDGRIVQGGTAVVVFDTRLRETNRSTGELVVAPATVPNQARVVGADLVGYPGVSPVTHTDTDTASLQLVAQGIGITVGKLFAPDTQTEPDRTPVTMTLSGQPSGPSRSNWMEIVDTDETFWNAYDFVGFAPGFTLTAPIDRVQVDALTGGSFSESGGGVAVTGATWQLGVPATTPTLPAGVSPVDVQGLRFTFTRADGSIWQNPSTPRQPVPLRVQRRTDLRTGGPVLSDMTGNPPAPGETAPGVASNTIQATVRGADLLGGQPITASGSAEDSILFRHQYNAVTVTKAPTGSFSPSGEIPFTLTFRNSGDAPIIDPVITDQIPSDADGPLLTLNPDRPAGESPYSFALAGAPPATPHGAPMPTDPADVSVTETPELLTFRFPAGSVLEPGQTYTVTVPMVFRAGLPGNTAVTNTTGITGDRPWDACAQVLDAASGECQASTTVRPRRAGALRGVKSVKAVDDELGVLDLGSGTTCAPDADGFYRGRCVPVTKPGGDEVWRLRFTNTGNLPMDRVSAIDRLPAVGDTAALVPLPRGSQWRPSLEDVTLVGASGLARVSDFRVFYTSDPDLCTADLDFGTPCPPGSWLPWTAAVDPDSVVALKLELDFAPGSLWQPLDTVTVDLTTRTPAQSETAGADTVAWNTVAAAGRTRDGATVGVAPKTEGNKVGVALATGPLAVTKEVVGDAAGFAPSTFTLDVTCTSAGEPVDLGVSGTVTVADGEVVTIPDLPWGSRCTVEDDRATSGASGFTATTVTVGRDDEPVALVTATNTYDSASLLLRKRADSSAVDQDGNPVVYGPFEFSVACTFLGAPVYADGYAAQTPMVATLDSGEAVRFTGLPAGASCTATETSTGGATSTTSTGVTADSTVQGDVELSLELTPDADGEGTNEVTFDNAFPVGRIVVTKVVDGPGAAAYGVGPFVVHLACRDSADRTVWDGDVVLGGEQPLTREIERVADGATCQASETTTGGATVSAVSPEGPFLVTAGEPVTVTATNTFQVGSVAIVKRLAGPGAPEHRDGRFVVRLACTAEVDGVPQPVPVSHDGRRMLSRDTGLRTVVDGLPTGATCTVTELRDGGAESTTIRPGTVVVGDGTTAEVVVVNRFASAGNAGAEDSGPATGPTSETGGRALESPWLLLVAALFAAGCAVAATVGIVRRP